MTREEYDSFAEIVQAFAELKGRQMSASALMLYWHVVREWSLLAFKAAANHLVVTSPHMPMPADFASLRRAWKTTPVEAWNTVLEHAKTCYSAGRYVDKPIGDPIIDTAIAGLGGYPVVMRADDTRLSFLRRDFEKRFEELSDVTDVRLSLGNDMPISKLRSPVGTQPKHISQTIPAKNRKRLPHGL